MIWGARLPAESHLSRPREPGIRNSGAAARVLLRTACWRMAATGRTGVVFALAAPGCPAAPFPARWTLIGNILSTGPSDVCQDSFFEPLSLMSHWPTTSQSSSRARNHQLPRRGGLPSPPPKLEAMGGVATEEVKNEDAGCIYFMNKNRKSGTMWSLFCPSCMPCFHPPGLATKSLGQGGLRR